MLQKKNKFYGLLVGLFVAFGWGSIGLWVKEIPISALEIATYRFIGAGLFLTLFSFKINKKNHFLISKKIVLKASICGMILALQFLTSIFAFQELQIGEATVLTNLQIFIIVLAYLNILVQRKKLLAGSISCLILIVLSLNLLSVGNSSNSFNYIGVISGLSSSALFGIYTILVGKFFPDNPEKYLFLIFSSGALFIISILLINGGIHIMNLDIYAWISLLILILFSTIGAHLSYLLAIKWMGSLEAGILSYFAIIVALSIDLFMGVNIEPKQWGGAILLICVLIVMDRINVKLSIKV